MEHYKISREILNLGRKLSIKLNVALVGDNNSSFINMYAKPNSQTMKGISLSPNAFITFEYKEGAWSKDKTIIINELNLAKVVKGFKNVHKHVYEGDIFAQNKKGEVVIYADRAKECTVHIGLGNQNMLLQPAVITDDSGLTYEGVILYINNSENVIELAIDWFDGIIRVLDKIDIFAYSQALLNFYIGLKENEKIMNETEVKKIPKKKKTSTLKGSNATLVKDEDPFDGLEGI